MTPQWIRLSAFLQLDPFLHWAGKNIGLSEVEKGGTDLDIPSTEIVLVPQSGALFPHLNVGQHPDRRVWSTDLRGSTFRYRGIEGCLFTARSIFALGG